MKKEQAFSISVCASYLRQSDCLEVFFLYSRAKAHFAIVNIRKEHFILCCCSFLGQERFGNMTRVYYKEAVGAFVVFDVTRVATFDAVLKWKQDLDSKVQLPDGSSIPCVLLANKVNKTNEYTFFISQIAFISHLFFKIKQK